MASTPSSALAAASGPSSAAPPQGGTSSPCAACKFLRRKCQPDCVFAPYFPPDNPQKFVHVHRVFGASNVTKLLNELHPLQREDAVNSLAYEAEARLRDPVYGCVGVISLLQHNLRQVQMDLACARSELSKYQSTLTNAGNGNGTLININLHPSMGVSNSALGLGFGREQFFQQPTQQQQQQQQQFMVRNHDAELAARVGANGTYDGGVMMSMNASASLMGSLGGSQFMKPGPAGGSERHSVGPL